MDGRITLAILVRGLHLGTLTLSRVLLRDLSQDRNLDLIPGLILDLIPDLNQGQTLVLLRDRSRGQIHDLIQGRSRGRSHSRALSRRHLPELSRVRTLNQGRSRRSREIRVVLVEGIRAEKGKAANK